VTEKEKTAFPINKKLVARRLLRKLKQAAPRTDLIISLHRKFKCN